MKDVLRQLERAGRTSRLSWQLQGSTLTVLFPNQGRRHRIRVDRRGDMYVFESVVASSGEIPAALSRRDLIYNVWRRNTLTEVVTFAFDRYDRVIGIIEQPAATLDLEELQTYLELLAIECDRFRYALAGSDRQVTGARQPG